MKVKVLFHDGTAMFGKLIGDEIECLKASTSIRLDNEQQQ